jgi:hypothetical protein
VLSLDTEDFANAFNASPSRSSHLYGGGLEHSLHLLQAICYRRLRLKEWQCQVPLCAPKVRSVTCLAGRIMAQ